MKKFTDLLNAIKKEDAGLAYNLAIELYNDVRNFSQSISIKKENGQLVVTNDRYAPPEYVLTTKQKIQEWVGGH